MVSVFQLLIGMYGELKLTSLLVLEKFIESSDTVANVPMVVHHSFCLGQGPIFDSGHQFHPEDKPCQYKPSCIC